MFVLTSNIIRTMGWVWELPWFDILGGAVAKLPTQFKIVTFTFLRFQTMTQLNPSELYF